MVSFHKPLTLIWPAVLLAILAQLNGRIGHVSNAFLSIYLVGVIVLLLAKLGDQLWQDRYWLLDACRGRPVDIRQSRVRALFDAYAKRFDHELVDDLGYKGPELAREMLDLVAEPNQQFDVVDLGCGTGLAASALGPFARTLQGCDISKPMLDKARARGAYDALQQADLTLFLREHEQRFDLAVALDVLIYIEDGWTFFKSAYNALRTGGYLIVTTELPATGPSPNAKIARNRGRRQETRDVTVSVAAAAGLQLIAEREEILRYEAGKPVAAGIYLWQRQAYAQEDVTEANAPSPLRNR